MDIAYSKLLLRNAELLAEIEELKKQNRLLTDQLRELNASLDQEELPSILKKQAN